MRIVIVAEVFLPKIDGVVNRTLNLIRQLLAAGDQGGRAQNRVVGQVRDEFVHVSIREGAMKVGYDLHLFRGRHVTATSAVSTDGGP